MYGHATPPSLSSSASTSQRARTMTGSSSGTSLASGTMAQTPSTAYTSPDLAMSGGMSGIGMGQNLGLSGYGLGMGAGGVGGAVGMGMGLNGSSSNLASLSPDAIHGGTVTNAVTGVPEPTIPQTGVTPLTPVSAMPTGDAEAQVGWVKVADPDPDAFMAYGAIVPEFVRLEGLLAKSIV